jgi:hypothetical protein
MYMRSKSLLGLNSVQKIAVSSQLKAEDITEVREQQM